MFDAPKGPWEIVPFAFSSADDRHIDELDREGVESFLRQFKSDYGVMSHLRAVLAPTDPVGRLTDDQVIVTVAWRLATHDLLFRGTIRRFSTQPGGSGGGGGSQPGQPGPGTQPGGGKKEAPEPSHPPRQKHWIGIRAVDEAGKAVKDVTAELLLTGGSQASVDFSTEPVEPDGTWRTEKVLDYGQCTVSFPDLYNVEWWPQGGSGGDGSAAQTATVAGGDCAISLADKWGFREYLTAWNNAKNKDLKAGRPNPNQLLEGDVLNAPDQKDKTVKKFTDQVWTFVVKTKKPAKLRLVLVDKNCAPLSGKAWELLSPIKRSGTTGAGGLIEVAEIPLQETSASLKVKLSEPPAPPPPEPPAAAPVIPTPYPPDIVEVEFTDKDPSKESPSHTAEWTLQVGSLPTYNADEGVRARLHNLGFGCDVEDGADVSARAVKAYQRFFLKNMNGTGVAKDIESDIRDRHDKAR
jgi:hypothetical protein